MNPKPVPSISSGIPDLDLAIGCAGYPGDRVVELFGNPGAPKVQMARWAIAAAQAVGARTAWVETSGTEPDAPAGCRVFQAEDSGQTIDLIRSAMQDGAHLIVVNSVPTMEHEDRYSTLARNLSKGLRVLTGEAHSRRCCIIFINEPRRLLGRYGFPTELLPGGNALKFYASVRIKITRTKTEEGGPAWEAWVVKNKMGPPFSRTTFVV